MKKILILSISLLFVQVSFGQACTKYKLKYIGTFKTNLVKVHKIKLPTAATLHGLDFEFIVIEPKENDINVQINSPLIGVFTNAEDLLGLYKKEKKYIPIHFIVTKGGKKEKITVKLTWDKVTISKIEENSGFSFFELNLNEIKID
jgi:hypothetical protein